MIEFEGIQPIVSVDVLASNLRYYVEKLGFTVAWEWGEPVRHIEREEPRP